MSKQTRQRWAAYMDACRAPEEQTIIEAQREKSRQHEAAKKEVNDDTATNLG